MPEHDPVNHPSHYTQGKIEVIDFIEDQQLGFHEANTLKYICRARHKNNELEDLKKARWYLDRKIQKLEEAQVLAETLKSEMQHFDEEESKGRTVPYPVPGITVLPPVKGVK